MRWQSSLLVGALLLWLGLPANGEQIKYYVWTDDDGVVHAEDRPPKDRDYETRIIEVDTTVSPPPSPVTRRPSSGSGPESGSSSSSRRSGDQDSSDDLETRIADEEQRRLDADPGTNPGTDTGEPPTAEGGATATSGSAASTGSTAGSASTAGGAATAAPATFGP